MTKLICIVLCAVALMPVEGNRVANLSGGGGDAGISAPTFLDAATNTNSAEEFMTSGSVSPTGDSLLVVTWLCRTGGDTDDILATSITDTLTGTGAWTIDEQERVFGSESLAVGIGHAFMGSSPGSGTITVNFTNAGGMKAIHVMEVAGANATPIVQSASNSGVAISELTVTLVASPASTSMVIGSVAYEATPTVTPGTGFTELQDTSVNTMSLQSQYDLEDADTTVDWTTLPNGAGKESTAVAIEIQ